MTLNPEDYSIQKPYIKIWLDNKPNFNYLAEVGPIALATNTHIIIVSYFIGELYGFTDEIRDKIKRDMNFYNIKKVNGYENS
jgi:hypothetical protein